MPRTYAREEIDSMGKRRLTTDDSSLFDWFSQFDPTRLLALIARLQLEPGNHFHLLRLERAAQLAASVNTKKKGLPALAVLTRRLNEDGFLGEVKHLQDPPENLFTENIVFFGGNYVVYPGLADGVGFGLGTLLEAFFLKGDLDKQLRALVARSARALLAVSDHVAGTLRHTRWMDSPKARPPSIVITPGEAAEQKEVARLSEEHLRQILAAADVAIEDLSPFIIDRSDIRRADAARLDDHPLQRRPIVRSGSDYIVALPCSLSSALRRFVLVLADKVGQLRSLMTAFRSVVEEIVFESLRLMQFRQIAYDFSSLSPPDLRAESIWRFDSDKVCCVEVVIDEANEYDPLRPFGEWPTSMLQAQLREHVVRVGRAGLAVAADVQKCLVLVVFAGIGRAGGLSLAGAPAEGVRCSVIDVETLFIFSRQRRDPKTSLSLWKFFEISDSMPAVSQGSLLDRIALYQERGKSLYMGDDDKTGAVFVDVGFGRPLRAEVARSWDRHAVESDESGGFVAVVRRYDQEIPISAPFGRMISHVARVVEGYPQPWWVRAAANDRDGGTRLAEVVDAVAYWLWQLTPALSRYLGPLGRHICTVELSAHESFFSGPYPDGAMDSTARPWFPTVDPMRRTINLALPEELLPLLSRADNQGERIMLESLLAGVDQLGRQRGVQLGIDADIRREMIESISPLGLKKKFSAIDPRKNPALVPWPIRDVRYVDDHDVERDLDGLALDVLAAVAPGALPVRGIVPKSGNKILLDAVKQRYLKRLRSSLDGIDARSLLTRLICITEAISHQLAHAEYTAPMAAACFRDAAGQAEYLASVVPRLNRAAISVRFLIEFVTAAPGAGSGAVSDELVDRLIGLSYGYFYWGMLADELRCRIVDRPFYMLASGRVGFDRAGRTWNERFMLAKSLESLEDKARALLPRSASPVSVSKADYDADVKETDLAFRAEFGFSLEELARVNASLQGLGLNANPGEIVDLGEEDAIRRIREQADMDDGRVRAVLQCLCLEERGGWAKEPRGYDSSDLLPWHFNRRLSLIRRPIVRLVAPRSGECRLMWGARHVSRAVADLVGIVVSGRYKLEHCKSNEMRELRGRIVLERGDAFEKKVASFVRTASSWQVEGSVEIGPGRRLHTEEDLGDVDVFVLNSSSRVAYACECKHVLFGRTPAEIVGELDRLFRGDPRRPEEVTRAAMHSKRADWLAGNWSQVSKVLGLASGRWKLIPLMVFESEIPSTFVIDPPLPVLSFSHIRREGVGAFEALRSGRSALRCQS